MNVDQQPGDIIAQIQDLESRLPGGRLNNESRAEITSLLNNLTVSVQNISNEQFEGLVNHIQQLQGERDDMAIPLPDRNDLLEMAVATLRQARQLGGSRKMRKTRKSVNKRRKTRKGSKARYGKK
jgi:hypothetical protein